MVRWDVDGLVFEQWLAWRQKNNAFPNRRRRVWQLWQAREASANLASCTRRLLWRVERGGKIKGLKYATLYWLNRDHSATLDPRP